uniref:Uncharacterized protein n=1 Tax=Medicago truncatula TaxID=3880 RepID=Q2HTA2_MEDTR|nr:hypothetical protein MtrDRAFT_AC150776g4v2 [Medicago truncatula]ABN08913.1 hypothetical protein MtrDRAFT_AC161749g14v2 [Medicago truncatula]
MTVNRARILIEEWQNAQGTCSAQIVVQDDNSAGSRLVHQLKWQRPPRGQLKCNVDVGF